MADVVNTEHNPVHVSRITRGVNFTASSYTGKITSDEDGTTFAIATDAKKLLIQNLETTDVTEFAVLAFGTSAADAQTNLTITGTTPNKISTTGLVIGGGHTGTGSAVRGESIVVDIPVTATHAALGNGTAGDTQVCMVTQGV
jgi:hypothetical protein